MAQVLKETQRTKIISSAKSEFVANGIKNTSMRSIARNADMTVGNLYRYFGSKNEIVDAVIAPALEKLSYNSQVIIPAKPYFFKPTQNFITSDQKLKETLMLLADNIIQIEDEYSEEMLIIVSDDEINARYSSWFLTLIQHILKEAQPTCIKTPFQFETLSVMLAKAIFTGLREGVKLKCKYGGEKEEFRVVLRYYLVKTFTLISESI